MTALLLARLALGIVPATTIDGASLTCVTLTRAETRYRGAHAFVCVAPDGEVRGAMLRKHGAVLCPIRGLYDGACLALTYCGETVADCR